MWKQKQTFGISKVLSDALSILEKVLLQELESIQKKAEKLQQLQQMKEKHGLD